MATASIGPEGMGYSLVIIDRLNYRPEPVPVYERVHLGELGPFLLNVLVSFPEHIRSERVHKIENSFSDL